MKQDVTKYIEALASNERAALSVLRAQILQLIPDAEERLSRGVPFFYHRGKRVVGFRASKGHLSFFIMEGKVLDEFRGELAAFDNSSTVVRFNPENPLLEELIKKTRSG